MISGHFAQTGFISMKNRFLFTEIYINNNCIILSDFLKQKFVNAEPDSNNKPSFPLQPSELFSSIFFCIFSGEVRKALTSLPLLLAELQRFYESLKKRYIKIYIFLKSANSDMENCIHKKNQNVPCKKIIYSGNGKLEKPLFERYQNYTAIDWITLL